MLLFRSFFNYFLADIKRIRKGACASILVITVCTAACMSYITLGKNVTGPNSIKLIQNSGSYGRHVMENRISALPLSEEKQAVIKEAMEKQAQIKCTQARMNENTQRELSIQKQNVNAAKKKVKSKKQINLNNQERTILERIVEAEAGDQDIKGRMLVANVVMNRVKSKEFPNSVKKVVYQHRGSCYQFSPVMSGYINKVKVSKATKVAVNRVLKGENESRGAMYFIQRNIAGKKGLSWFDRSLTKLFKHGCHTFYK